MLKWLLIVLIAANAAFFAWTQGWLDSVVGVRSIGDREPGRLAQQVRPDSVVILSASAVASAASAAKTASASASSASAAAAASAVSSLPSACLEAGPFTGPALAAAETTLATLMPASAWTKVSVDVPGSWAVYMGPYQAADLRAKKEAELRRRGLKYEAFKLPPELGTEQRNALSAQLVPGLSLGFFDSAESAEAALAKFGISGVNSARVVELFKPYAAQTLRVDKAEAALVTRLKGLTGGAALSKPFVACS